MSAADREREGQREVPIGQAQRQRSRPHRGIVLYECICLYVLLCIPGMILIVTFKVHDCSLLMLYLTYNVMLESLYIPTVHIHYTPYRLLLSTCPWA